MKPPSTTDLDAQRGRLLQELRILDGEPEPSLDAIARLASVQAGGERGDVLLADADTVWCLASSGGIAAPVPLAEAAWRLMLAEPVSDDVNHSSLAAPIEVEGLRIGVVCAACGEAATPASSARVALHDLALLAGTLLTTRLREQRARLLDARVRTASSAASDWLWETDADGVVTWLTINLPAHDASNPGPAVGERWLQPYEMLASRRPDDWERCLAAFAAHEAFEDVLTDGSSSEGMVTVSSSGRPVFDKSGRFMGFRGASRNVTAELRQREVSEIMRLRQRSELIESQGRLSAILGAIPDLWFVMDAAGHYLQSNSPDHPLLLRPFDEIRGMPLRNVLPQEVAAAWERAITRTLLTGETQRVEYMLEPPGKGLQLFDARVSAMPGGRVLGLARDVTELRTLERDRLVLQRALEAEAAMPIAVLEALTTEGTVLLVNTAFERMTGYSRTEMLGARLCLLTDGLPPQPGVSLLEAAIASGEATTAQVVCLRKDGTRFDNEIHLAPVRDATGQLIQCVCVLNDVTARAAAAEKLRMSEELYRAVATAMSDGMLIVIPGGAIAAANPAGCSILGVEARALLGRSAPWPFSLSSVDGEAEADGGQPAAASGDPLLRALALGTAQQRQSVLLRRQDGSTRWLELSCHPLRVPTGAEAPPMLATFRDITAQRSAEQSLATSEERWKFALEGSRQGVWDWDARDEGLFFSDAWKSILGYAPHEVGDSYSEWESRIHPDDAALSSKRLGAHLRGETPLFSLEYRMRHRDGQYVWVHNRAKVVRREDNGRATRMVGTLVDVTAQRDAEATLREKQAAELASRAKTEFLSRMSHEMRTPLNAVIGFSQLLLNAPGEPEVRQVREYGEHVLRAGEHLLALINDVLDLQRVEEGRIVPRWEDVRLGEMIAQVNELLSATATQRQIRTEMRLDPDIAVRADSRLLRQVLLNIASNAVKYNVNDGSVRWSAGITPEGRVQIHLDDTGRGLTAQQLERLFEPFERLGQETSSIQGTGLGLIIARRLCLAMGGTLDVASRVGRGTRVTVTLPLSRTIAPAVEQLAVPTLISGVRALRPAGAPPMRVLYVEDNRVNAILFEAALRPHQGLELRLVEDGVQALEEVTDWLPDVLVLDAHLPGMDGFELFQALRRVPGLERTPAFMCSADAMPEDIQRAQIAGFAGYWTKPIDVSRIMSDLEDVSYALARRAERTRPPVVPATSAT